MFIEILILIYDIWFGRLYQIKSINKVYMMKNKNNEHHELHIKEKQNLIKKQLLSEEAKKQQSRSNPDPEFGSNKQSSSQAQENSPQGKNNILYAVTFTIAIAILGAGFFIISKSEDQVSQQQKQEWSENYANVGIIQLPYVTEQESGEAIASMNLVEEERIKLEQEVKAERIRLVWMTFWDTVAEDGDIVDIQSDAFQQRVLLYNKPTRIAVPEPISGVVNVTGDIDGGGGITVGIISGKSPVNLPYMSPGQTIGIPVSGSVGI